MSCIRRRSNGAIDCWELVVMAGAGRFRCLHRASGSDGCGAAHRWIRIYVFQIAVSDIKMVDLHCVSM